MNNHPHIATTYEIKALAERRLKAIVLPLVPQIQKVESELGTKLWYWKLDQIGFDSVEDLIRFLKETHTLPFQEGDRIYLQEEWDEVPVNFGEDVKPILKSIYPWWTDEWRSASTTPMEAAQHWFAINEVRVQQSLTIEECELAGLIDVSDEDTVAMAMVREGQFKERWDAAYPEQPWHGDRWAIVLDITPIQAPQFLQP